MREYRKYSIRAYQCLHAHPYGCVSTRSSYYKFPISTEPNIRRLYCFLMGMHSLGCKLLLLLFPYTKYRQTVQMCHWQWQWHRDLDKRLWNANKFGFAKDESNYNTHTHIQHSAIGIWSSTVIFDGANDFWMRRFEFEWGKRNGLNGMVLSESAIGVRDRAK